MHLSFLSNLINGISLGSVYAIIALGYTMVYGQPRRQLQVLGNAEGNVSADHDDVAVGEVQHFGDAVDHRVAERDDGVHAAEADAADEV